jgi:putative AbiEii toxin of type IV toxin-antitoxin system
MYLRELKVHNCKLLRNLDLSFDREDGTGPRMWTVFVGENGLCKTSLLRCIAMAAMGPEISTGLADVSALPDKRHPGDELGIHASFSFSEEHHSDRKYPLGDRFDEPPILTSELRLRAGHSIFRGESGYMKGSVYHESYIAGSPELLLPISEARSLGLRHWFVAGYGIGRMLQSPAPGVRSPDRAADRIQSLFDHNQIILGTRFADLFPEDRSRKFAEVLRNVFVDHEVLPGVRNVELQGKGGVRTSAHLTESHSFEVAVGHGTLKLPATWLSQGFQSVISLIADVIGHVWLETDAEIPPEEMEGLILIDEIDLHLHPKWQASLIKSLKAAFPRLQFIATTHSPMVLPSLEVDEVFILRQNEITGDVHVDNTGEAPRFMTGSELYGTFFDLDARFAEDIGRRLARYAYLASDPRRTEVEDQELYRLRAELRKENVSVDAEPVPRQV